MQPYSIKSALAQLRRVSSVEIAETRSGAKFQIVVHSEGASPAWHLEMSVPTAFPAVKPVISLIFPNSPHLAHVNHPGTVCVREGDGHSTQLDSPESVAIWWLEQALQILDSSASDAERGSHEPLIDEFAGYWNSIPPFVSVELLDVPEQEAQWGTGYFSRTERSARLSLVALEFNRSVKRSKYIGYQRFRHCNKVAVNYLPLSKPCLPPQRGHTVTLDYVRSLISKQPENVRARLERQLGSRRKESRCWYYLLSQPLSTGERCYFGITVSCKTTKTDPLLTTPKKAHVTAWGIKHHYTNYQMPRGGAEKSLRAYRIAIVGCGSLGGAISLLLAQTGLGQLTLIDPDDFDADNLYRHVLSPEYLNRPKVSALAGTLQRDLPRITVQQYYQSLEEWESGNSFHDVDMICLATGNPSLERAFVQNHLPNKSCPPILASWIEPLSLGGHAVLSRNGVTGCLECLYNHPLHGGQLHARSAFLEPNQNVQSALGGCEGAFTPYSMVDAMQTATVSTRLAIDGLTGDCPDFYRFWRGSADKARAESVTPSAVHANATAFDVHQVQEYLRNSSCPVCSAGT